jgi:ribonuclease VapC
LAECEIEIVPFDEAQLRAAVTAFDRYGKGIHPKARLNLADCNDERALLFKCNDFAATDVKLCL